MERRIVYQYVLINLLDQTKIIHNGMAPQQADALTPQPWLLWWLQPQIYNHETYWLGSTWTQSLIQPIRLVNLTLQGIFDPFTLTVWSNPTHNKAPILLKIKLKKLKW